MPLQLRSGPAAEPVSLADAKSFLRIDGSEDDVLVSSLITAARIYIETTIGVILIYENWSYFKDRWPENGMMHLPLSPVQTIEEIRLHDNQAGFEQLPTEHFETDLLSSNPRIKLLERRGLTNQARSLNHIEVQFTAGYGANETDVPKDLRQALLLLVSHWFEQREPVGFGGTFHEIPATITAILANHKHLKVQ